MSDFSLPVMTRTTHAPETYRIRVGSLERTFTVVGKPGARSLVVVLHGSRQNGRTHRTFTGSMFDALADDGSGVVAYLDGYRGNWNDARKESSFPARAADVDDVGFVRAVVQELAGSHGIDPRRVFAIGYSNGGQMVMRLLHEDPELLAGATIISATLPAPENFTLPQTVPAPNPVPVLMIHGTKDPIVAYGGGQMSWWVRLMFKVGGTALSMPDTARYFARRNGIDADAHTSGAPAPTGTTSVELAEYRQEGHPPVALHTIHGGGHTIPGSPDAPFLVGRTNHDVNTADLVADFFGIRNGRGVSG